MPNRVRPEATNRVAKVIEIINVVEKNGIYYISSSARRAGVKCSATSRCCALTSVMAALCPLDVTLGVCINYVVCGNPNGAWK